jgi:hypothetical protein
VGVQNLKILYKKIIYESSLDADTFLVFLEVCIDMSVAKWCFIEIYRCISGAWKENTRKILECKLAIIR